jgi:putative redox protein
MNSKKVTFKNRDGEQLSGNLELPVEGKAGAYALFAHCFTCNKNLNAVAHISRALALNNIGVLRFDFTGLGESEGEFSESNFSSNVSDLVDAAQHMASIGMPISVLIGHSLGGAAVLQAATLLDDVKSVVALAAPSSPEHVIKHLTGDLDSIREKGQASINIGGRPFVIRKQFLDDIGTLEFEETLAGLRKPVLIMHSPQDNIVGIENAARLYHQLHHPKSFISLDGADHLLSDKKDSLYAGNLIASWVERYIPFTESTRLTTDKQVVVRTAEEGFYTQIKAGKHSLQADEPESVGGTDLGPTPYGLLLSALGACTGMTLHLYAARKKWKIGDVEVHLSHSKEYGDDCDNCEDDQRYLDLIERELSFTGNLSEEQRQKLLGIADKCPVHKTLTRQVKIETVMRGN